MGQFQLLKELINYLLNIELISVLLNEKITFNGFTLCPVYIDIKTMIFFTIELFIVFSYINLLFQWHDVLQNKFHKYMYITFNMIL